MALAKSNPLPDDQIQVIRRLGLSPRQQELNRRWAWYTTQNYDNCKVDWDGRENPSPITHEQIVSEAQLPPGFLDAGGMFPLKFRKPIAPYRLPRVITNRFTGLLFSERQHPSPHVAGDEQTEDFIQGLIEDSRLWQRMMVARTLGGAQGTVIIGFVFLEGVPRVEVHDARWCMPTWADRHEFKLSSIEKRYQYPIEIRDPETGNWKEEAFWYRRVIDKKSDSTWDGVPVGSGMEPEWDRLEHKETEHGLGFCPCVWIQNLPVEDDIDGEPDCHGVYDMVAAMDQLLAQSFKGTIQNLDPTLLLVTKAKLAEIKKGSDNAIKLPEGGGGQYLEITGSGIREARELVKEWRQYVLEVTQCVLENETNQGASTAYEIARRYSMMFDRADVFREQYGEKGILPLLEMMVKAARKLSEPRVIEGSVQRMEVKLSPRKIEKEDGTIELHERELKPGKTSNIKLTWPDYVEPTAMDVGSAIDAASKAVLTNLLDRETAARHIAKYFHVKDVRVVLNRIDEEVKKRQAQIDQAAMERSGMMPMGGGF